MLIGGDFNAWLESAGHPTTRRFKALWDQCGVLKDGDMAEVDRQSMRVGLKLDSCLLNAPLVPWAMCDRSHPASGRSPASMGSDHGPVVLSIPLAGAAKDEIKWLAYSHAQGRLHTYVRTNRESAKQRRQCCGEPVALRGWLSSDHHTATMGTSEVQAVFDLLYAFRDEVLRVIGVRMPSGMDPQYRYWQVETEASLSQVLTDQQALAWRAHELGKRHAAGEGLPSREATALLQHLLQVQPGLSPATMEDLRAAWDQQLQ